MLKKISTIGYGSRYWVSLIMTGFLLQGVALYYQYFLNYAPCVVCVHIRMIIMAVMILAGAALALRPFKPLFILTQLLMVTLFIGLLERSWMALAVERYWVEGSCSLSSGLPSWFSLDLWFPFLFEIHTACGYTPNLVFGITMAEALFPLSAIAITVSVGITIASLYKKQV
jgi:protein dithiol:quinone oxidoreductase